MIIYKECSSFDNVQVLKCLNINLFNFFFITIIIVTIIQIRRGLKKGRKITSKKLIILYQLVLDLIAQIFLTSIAYNIFLYQFEANIRNLIFLSVFYYLTQKMSKLSSKRQQIVHTLNQITIVMLVLISLNCIFILVMILTDEEKDKPPCKINYDKISKIIGTICSFFLIFYGMKLNRKINSKTEDYFFQDQPETKLREFSIAENQKEDLWILLLTYIGSSFISIFLEIYFLMKRNRELSFPHCFQCQTIPCIDISIELTMAMEVIIRILIKSITTLLPSIALIRLFWEEEPVQNNIEQRAISHFENASSTIYKKMDYSHERTESMKINSDDILSYKSLQSQEDLNQ